MAPVHIRTPLVRIIRRSGCAKPLLTTRSFSSSVYGCADYDHAVIGAGVVGLAVARSLAQRGSTVLIERHRSPGTETSSRNSEVIHSSCYYPADSLKTKLCKRGKQLMYEACEKHGIGYRNTGKWIVAQTPEQGEALVKLEEHCKNIGVPMRWVSVEDAKQRQPDVLAREAILESPTTGIVDSHAFMLWLLGEFEAADGDAAFASNVAGIERVGDEWKVYIGDTASEDSAITVKTLINSAGLAAIDINNMIMPAPRQRQKSFAKGTYYSYSASQPKPSILVYPAPVAGKGGLGTHLTLDLGGQIRFGPDVQWVSDPTDLVANDQNLEQALDDIQEYLPGLQRDLVRPDYCGIRVKLNGKSFADFYIEREKELGAECVQLLGIESPGLTSSLAIAEHVDKLLYGS